MKIKYYLKKNCDNCNPRFTRHSCIKCKATGITRGADITELMERVERMMIIEHFEVFLRINADLIEIVEED